MLNRNKAIILLGLGTLFIFGLSGILIIWQMQGKNPLIVLMSGWDIPLQLMTGIVVGLVSARIAWFIITRAFFIKQKKFYQNLIMKLQLNNPKIIFISLCAGIGEEIFFRAALQPFLGIWFTSLIFVVLHGYLNPFNWRISIYGTVMVFVIAGFGYLFEIAGLITVMTAHTVFDIVLLKKMEEDDEINGMQNDIIPQSQ